MPLDERGVYISPDVDSFFLNQLDTHGIAPTFDDVTFSDWPASLEGVDPQDADVSTRLTPNLEMPLPFISSPMDTVTESDMAIAMAKLGGIGVLHAALDDREMKDQVHKVRHHLSAFIDQPISIGRRNAESSVNPDSSITELLAYLDEKEFSFSTVPVLDAQNQVAGLLTDDLIRLTADHTQPLTEAMIPRDELTIIKHKLDDPVGAHKIMQENRTKYVLVETDGVFSGMYVLTDVERIVKGESDKYNVDSNGRLMVSIAVPSDASVALPRIDSVRNHLQVVLIDSAKGGSPYVSATLQAIKAEFPDIDVIAGNVSGAEEARMLADAGADSLRIGQGGGSICTTRERTGIGTPQLAAVWQCARAVRDMPNPPTIIADGGIRTEKDIALAMSVGADSVMMGSKLAGADEAPGGIVVIEGARKKEIRGMGSEAALTANESSLTRYSAGSDGILVPEGVEGFVDPTGPLQNTIGFAAISLRRTLSYMSATDLAELRANARLVRSTASGVSESRPHSIGHIS